MAQLTPPGPTTITAATETEAMDDTRATHGIVTTPQRITHDELHHLAGRHPGQEHDSRDCCKGYGGPPD